MFRILKPRKGSSGYLQVVLYKDGGRKEYLVHRLVAEAYLPNPEEFLQVNHKDENKENNALQNLEWCTQSYNANYGSRNKRMAKSLSKPVFCEEFNRTFDGARAEARELGLDYSSINKCCTGEYKTCGGYHWRYQEVT